MESRFKIESIRSSDGTLMRKRSVFDLPAPTQQDVQNLKSQCAIGDGLDLKDNVKNLAQAALTRDGSEIQSKLEVKEAGTQSVGDARIKDITKQRDLTFAQ